MISATCNSFDLVDIWKLARSAQLLIQDLAKYDSPIDMADRSLQKSVDEIY